LNCAARNGDPTLAASAIKILSQRQTVLAAHHYEALLEAYVGAGDTKTAFRVLNIMYKAGINPGASSTRPLYFHLMTSPSQPAEGWKLLKGLHEDGYNIPTAGVNVVIEASVASNTPKIGSEQAFQFYREMHTICDTGPDIETFNHLLRRLGDVDGSKPRAMFLASEIRALGLRPTEMTYDRLILVCMHPNIEDYEDCFRYLEEMKVMGQDAVDSFGRKGWWLRRGTAVSLIRRCVNAGDRRAWVLIDEMEERDMVFNKALKRWVEMKLPRHEENVAEGDVPTEDLRITWNRDERPSSALGGEAQKTPSWGRGTSLA
jgi:pentatricopeptide repeat protein